MAVYLVKRPYQLSEGLIDMYPKNTQWTKSERDTLRRAGVPDAFTDALRIDHLLAPARGAGAGGHVKSPLPYDNEVATLLGDIQIAANQLLGTKELVTAQTALVALSLCCINTSKELKSDPKRFEEACESFPKELPGFKKYLNTPDKLSAGPGRRSRTLTLVTV